jgi:hypothetical protein
MFAYGIGVGLALALFGLALAVDFKGIATRHVSLTRAFMQGVVRRRLRRPLAPLVIMERCAGVVFAVVGVGLIVLTFAGRT